MQPKRGKEKLKVMYISFKSKINKKFGSIPVWQVFPQNGALENVH